MTEPDGEPQVMEVRKVEFELEIRADSEYQALEKANEYLVDAGYDPDNFLKDTADGVHGFMVRLRSESA